MPVVVVALAAGSFAAGATAFAAAATLAGTIAAGATMVGAALTIVGTVTGNAKLAKIGAIVGIAGGIGTMLSAGAEASASAAAATTATDTATTGTTAATSAAGDAAAGAAQTFPVSAPGGVDALPGAATGSGGGMLDAAGAAGSAGSAATPLTAADLGSQAVDTGMLGSLPDVTDPLAQAQASTTSSFDSGSTVTGQKAAATGQAPNAYDPNAIIASPNADMSQPQMPTPLGTGTDPGRMAQMAAWVKQNPELAKMALSAGSAAMGNLVPSSKDKAMMDAYKQQSALSAAQTDALKRKAAWGAGRTTY